MAESNEKRRSPGYLTVDKILKSKIVSLDVIESQVCKAGNLIPPDNEGCSVNGAELVELRSLLFSALENLKTFKQVYMDEVSIGLKSAKVSQVDLMNSKWKRLGEGGFSNVFQAKLKGNTVAIKVLKDFNESKALFTEGNLLRDFRHDNIVAFRGMDVLENDITDLSIKAASPFIVMEYIPNNLYKYVESQRTPESKGLPFGQVWNFIKQAANGLLYLHSLAPSVSHRDLKPDNVLLDIRSMRVKLADFGLSRQILASSDGMVSMFQARWTAPEIWDYGDDNEAEHTDSHGHEDNSEGGEFDDDVSFYLRADIYSYGQVLAYLITGDMPWSGKNSLSVIDIREKVLEKEDKVVVPEEVPGQLKEIIKACRDKNPKNRPTVQDLVNQFFTSDVNPFQSEAESAEFFSCGFLRDTKIFVADSLVDESSEGYIKTKETPQGYPVECLLCEVEVGNDDYNDAPDQWFYEHKYREYYAHFRQAAIVKKTIEDNPAIALKHLVTPREDEEERQEILLRFGQSTYCHHRAMREIWMKVLDESKRKEFVACKSVIHPVFSTSFGLHVAVLTADSPPKFIFARRANREGMATPGKFTCGAVESASVKDYEFKNGKAFVNLIQTAARGLEEELRVELKGNDVEALCLSTVYLKFDTHEWGLCGFVNLSDSRIDPVRRLSFEQLGSRFSAGPKDKFEHEEVIAVDFTLPTMVEFVRENFQDFASSAKLVVVKVLQSFFGVNAVEQAFKSYTE